MSTAPIGTTTTGQLSEVERALTMIVRWGNLPRIRERFAAAAGVAIDRASYSLLARLDGSGPTRLSDLAQRVGVDLSTASRQVHHLEAGGFVGKTIVEEDRRAALLTVTDKGQDLIQRLRAAKRAVITEMLAGWTPDEREELGRVLGRLADEMVAFGCRDR
ncbi:MAG TPA: MarR family transcriptional regulator [Actinomycetota bacterium]|nr:MarR family transcriptional regulator [Actinomycetota bacterium]